MYVLFDLEWTTTADDPCVPTQLAALRTDAAWQPQKQFQALICPADPEHCNWNSLPYNGSSPEEFLSGPYEEDCFQKFFRWLAPEDILCCWHHQNGEMLELLYTRWLGGALPWRWVAVNHPVYTVLTRKNIVTSGGLYRCAGRCGLPLPTPEHRSCNDVSVLRTLLDTLQLPERFLAPRQASPVKPPTGLTRRELTAQRIARTCFNYIYLPDSPVFHRRDCKLVLNSKEFFGSVRYRTAARHRRPCKVCKPIPEYTVEQEQEYREEVRQRALRSAEKDRQIREANEVIHVRLLGNHPIDIRRKLLVGCCHNHLHPGRMTQKLMEEHDCLRKNCRFFEKYEEASYWRAQAEKNAARQKAKLEKQQKRSREAEILSYKELFQSYADAIGYSLQLVRVQEDPPGIFKIFYVSENPFRDGGCFPNFISMIQEKHPRCRILMRHIQDLQGHFVTIDEYAQIRR